MSSAVTEISCNKMFGGWNRRYRHKSETCGCDMVFTVYYPPSAEYVRVPVLYYLSGLSCTDENFITKANAQRKAAELGIALVAPDTSPRGLGVPGEADHWDFGVGAGFYVNATVEKWRGWQMYDYVVSELPALLANEFGNLDTSRASITGHSMGGHGALSIALKNPGKYRSVSAFSPICNPINAPWGIKAFGGYLGDDKSKWAEYDTTEILKTYQGPKIPMLVDTGTADKFYAEQLKPEALQAACLVTNYPATLRLQAGYDHSYYFIASFIEDHLAFHSQHLKA